MLRDLGAQAAKGKTAEEAWTIAAETLAAHPQDIPFALLYLIAPDRKTAWLTGSAVSGDGRAGYASNPIPGGVSSQIATSIATAREYEEEKKRAEALAEIDRAKTVFFSNPESCRPIYRLM